VLQRTRAWSEATAFLSSVKGMDPETGWFPSDVIYQATRSDYIAVMSGASVADEMLAGRPVFLTLACANLTLGRELIDRIENESLRLELTDDVRGLEISGVGKNIVAIGAGIADGLGLGENFRSAFIARGIVELTTVADRCGGRGETIVSTGSLADVILSCSSPRTRNYSYGLALGRGEPPPQNLAEGRVAADSFMRLLRAHGIESAYFTAIIDALADPTRLMGALDALPRQ
jgi:glycerol-3-phosphate dehydrogenase (NAD(P)+)